MKNDWSVIKIADSIGEDAPRITTFQLKYPRIVHAELMTHRVFSRNASSSRAIPVTRLADWDKFVPLFRENKPGMQPGKFLGAEQQDEAEALWEEAAEFCLKTALKLADKDGLNVHKQWANRMLEWFGYINVLVTSTEWSNFIALRTEQNDDLMPVPQDELWLVAKEIEYILKNSKPTLLTEGQWHLPYITDSDIVDVYDLELLKKISTARCARLSYTTHDGRRGTIEEELALYDRLVGSHPIHASPAEHQATPDKSSICVNMGEGFDKRHSFKQWHNPHRHGNFTGWIQNRKLIPGESL